MARNLLHRKSKDCDHKEPERPAPAQPEGKPQWSTALSDCYPDLFEDGEMQALSVCFLALKRHLGNDRASWARVVGMLNARVAAALPPPSLKDVQVSQPG